MLARSVYNGFFHLAREEATMPNVKRANDTSAMFNFEQTESIFFIS
ncbi:hypothetical protein ACUIAK_13045 [Bacillus cytotoxicus]